MYTKKELESMDIPQLMGIADELGVKVSPNDELEEVIYAILDRAAEASAAEAGDSPKRKRTRIMKKDTNKVYTVNGKEGENFDLLNGKKKAEKQPALFNDLPVAIAEDNSAAAETAETSDTQETDEAPQPKKRGRKPKAVKEAEEAAKREAEENATHEVESGKTANTNDLENTNDIIPEAEIDSVSTEDNISDNDKTLLEQLQEKMTKRNADFNTENTEGIDMNNVWDGDPNDGTDFIIVTDLPIEDTEAMGIVNNGWQMDEREMLQPMVAPAMQGAEQQETYDFSDIITGNGVLEILSDGYGFLRSSDYNYLSSPDDIYVSPQQIKKYGLKTGDVVDCTVRTPNDNEKYFAMCNVNTINGRNPSEVRDRVAFEHLTPLFPEEKFNLCGDKSTVNPSVRIVDLFSPIGKGQRALIVAQPKTGKTILMKDIANAIAANHPEAYLMMLLIDERPEEVTDMSRTVNAEVIASTFDEPAERHVKIAGIVLEKAKRLVECGHDVVIFLDSITRLARAYNTVSPASGKVLTGGVDANALQKPKRFFGAARNIEGGGSLTIIATALIDTGSKMDEVIFEEFKGTGNMELQLDRSLSNKRIFPAVNLVQSSTRRDDLLQDETTLNRMWVTRNYISDMNPIEAMNAIRDRLIRTNSNEEFLMSING